MWQFWIRVQSPLTFIWNHAQALDWRLFAAGLKSSHLWDQLQSNFNPFWLKTPYKQLNIVHFYTLLKTSF